MHWLDREDKSLCILFTSNVAGYDVDAIATNAEHAYSTHYNAAFIFLSFMHKNRGC